MFPPFFADRATFSIRVVVIMVITTRTIFSIKISKGQRPNYIRKKESTTAIDGLGDLELSIGRVEAQNKEETT